MTNEDYEFQRQMQKHNNKKETNWPKVVVTVSASIIVLSMLSMIYVEYKTNKRD